MELRVLAVEHEDDAGPARVGEWLAAEGVALEVAGPWRGDGLPASLDPYAGLVVLGGAMGPTDDVRAPWLPAVRELLREAVRRDLPTLAICLGAELLTVALGGEVGPAALPEVGLHPLAALPDCAADPVFGPLAAAPAPRAVQWHFEETRRLPPGAVPLLTSGRCAHQAYRIGDQVWATQFHPETLAADIVEWGRSDTGALRGLGLDPDDVVAAVAADEAALTGLWSGLTRRWAGRLRPVR
ncbi:type 1 glutamine amidotransferase [Streptomyces sp. NPDC050504]|uniref:type 1 glutamine amidotransferase n=1 Tax=Streptomyces sp. NPDC050504 TaxID=3365618 RepID=UPI00378AF543